MFDLKKCFDTINHKFLLGKLTKYGIHDKEHKWFSSYLHDRNQVVTYHGSCSQPLPLRTGVPQGSNLGPLLFFKFINDLTSYLPGCSYNLYADDTLIYVSASDADQLSQKLHLAVDNVVTWFHENKLTINLDKTYTMLISSKFHPDNNNKLNIYINNTILDQKSELNYLGVIIDDTLSWLPHINYVCKKVAPKIGALTCIRYLVPTDILHTIFNSTILPIIDYTSTVWGHCGDNKLKKLQKYQNRAARIITNNFDWSVSGMDVVKSLGWKTLSERVVYFTSTLMFKCLNGLAPNYLSHMFTFHNDIVERPTRLSDQLLLYMPKPKTEIYRQSLLYKGSLIWNNIPLEIKQSENLGHFKHLLKNNTV